MALVPATALRRSGAFRGRTASRYAPATGADGAHARQRGDHRLLQHHGARVIGMIRSAPPRWVRPAPGGGADYSFAWRPAAEIRPRLAS
jgi:hypothetical protein